jgi:hypothetical protein
VALLTVRAPFGRFIALTAAAVLSVAACPQPTTAADAVPAATLRAAFLFNFARFTEWPGDGPAGPLTLCVVGDPAVADALDHLAGDRQIGGRDVSIARLVSPRAVKTCQLLYLASPDAVAQARMLDEVARLPILTIGEGEQFVHIGGVVGLFLDSGRMRFAINTDAVLRAGLKLSSRLLGLAKVLRDEHVQS